MPLARREKITFAQALEAFGPEEQQKLMLRLLQEAGLSSPRCRGVSSRRVLC